MNKKYIIGGLLFWAGLSGYMGLRVLESYTEDAVYAVLSVVSAQAQEIRYSFLDDSLRVKGIEYDIPSDTIMHKGTIESVEVKNFARKIMFVKPQMPPYQADELPRVGESFLVTGIVDSVHEGHTRVERRIGTLEVKGWYQRLGVLLDRYTRDGITAPFFEELFRSRVDEISASQLSMTVSEPDKPVLSVSAARFDVPGGIQPPRGTEKSTPKNLVFDGVTFAQGDMSGSIGRVDTRALQAPDPEQLERLLALSKDVRNDKPGAVDELMETFMKSYEKRPPFGLVSVQDLRVKPGQEAEPVSLGSASYALTYVGDGYKDSFACKELRIPAKAFGELSAAVALFAPDGLSLSLSSEGQTDSTSMTARTACEVAGLGRMAASVAIDGDLIRLKKLSLNGKFTEADPFDLLAPLRLRDLKLEYADSGFLALVLSAMAQQSGVAPAVVLEDARNTAGQMAADSNTVLSSLGKALREQLENPGELTVEVAPQEPMGAQAMFQKIFTEPQAFPLRVTSIPGKKPLELRVDQPR